MPPMRRAFATNVVLLLAVNALIKPAYLLGVDLGVQNAVGTAEYGRLAYWYSFAFVFGTVLDFGLQNYNAVQMSRRPERIAEQPPLTLSLKLALSAGYLACVMTAALISGADAADLRLAAYVAATQVALSIWQLLRTNVAAQGRYAVNSLLSVADKAQLLLVVGTILLYPPLSPWITVERFVLLQLASLLVATALTLRVTRLPPGRRWWRWDAPALLKLMRGASPYALTLLLSTVAARVDVLMIEALLADGFYAAGVYAAGYRLLDALNMVSYLFASLLLPMLGALVERGEPVRALLHQGTRYVVVVAGGAAAYLSFHAGAVTTLLYAEADATWGPVLSALTWSAIGTALMYVHGSYLLVRERLRLANGIFVAASVANVGLNLLLLPRYGVWGAAVATALTQGGVALADWYYAERLAVGGGRPAGVVLRCGGYVALALAVAYATAQLAWPLWVTALAQAGACAAAALGLGLVVDPGQLLARLRMGGRE